MHSLALLEGMYEWVNIAVNMWLILPAVYLRNVKTKQVRQVRSRQNIRNAVRA